MHVWMNLVFFSDVFGEDPSRTKRLKQKKHMALWRGFAGWRMQKICLFGSPHILGKKHIILEKHQKQNVMFWVVPPLPVTVANEGLKLGSPTLKIS